MAESYEQRRSRLIRPAVGDQEPPGFLWGHDYLAEESPPASEELLDAVDRTAWTSAAFAQAAQLLLQQQGLVGRVYSRGEVLPTLQSDSVFKHMGQYAKVGSRWSAGQQVVVSVISEAQRVIGFAIGAASGSSSSLEIMAVDEFATRSAGLHAVLSVEGRDFTVGVAHAAIALLLPRLPRPVHANATTESSRYVCKSLGLLPVQDQNPCLLVLR